MSAYAVTVGEETFTVVLKGRRGDTLTFVIDEREYTISVDPTELKATTPITIQPLSKDRAHRSSSSSKTALPPELRAPLPGIISEVKAQEGDTVSAGGTLVVIEAMKMENPIKAPADLRVTKVHVKKGQEIGQGAPLVSVEPL